MNANELDDCYSALCETMGRLGEQKSTLLLAMLCLSLMSRHSDAAEVRRLIEQAEAGVLRQVAKSDAR